MNPSSIIIPPPEIRDLIEITSDILNSGGKDTEIRLISLERSNAKYSFLNENDPYHPFYSLVRKGLYVERGEPNAPIPEIPHKRGTAGLTSVFYHSFNFSPLSCYDFDHIRLVALFASSNESSFLSTLVSRELKNPQYDFMKMGHSLYDVYRGLVKSYADVSASSMTLFSGGSQLRLFNLINAASESVSSEGSSEPESASHDQVDWSSFIIADIIDFTVDDKSSDLPTTLFLNDYCSLPISMRQELYFSGTIQKTPKSMSEATGNEQFVICPLCKGRIPASQYEQHIRVETVSSRSIDEHKRHLAKYDNTSLESSSSAIRNNIAGLISKKQRLDKK